MACTREYSLMGRNACVSKTLSRSLIAISHSSAKRISRPPFVSKAFRFSSLSRHPLPLLPTTNFIPYPFLHFTCMRTTRQGSNIGQDWMNFPWSNKREKEKKRLLRYPDRINTRINHDPPPLLLMELDHWKRFQETSVPFPWPGCRRFISLRKKVERQSNRNPFYRGCVENPPLRFSS